MKTLRTATTLSLATTALLLSGGAAMADTGSGSWPTAYPLPQGTVVTESSDAAVVRSTAVVIDVKAELDALYVGQLGCVRNIAVNKPRDYFCTDASTGKTDEVWFTFAALEFTPGASSQTNAYLVQG